MALILWGALFGWVCSVRLRRGFGGQAARQRSRFLIMLGLVVSHWVLDFVTHIPDLPLYPGGPKYGLGLWNSVAGTFAVEIVMFAIGVWIYARATRAADRDRCMGVRGRDRIPADRISRQRKRHAAAVGDRAVGDGAGARWFDACAGVVGGQAQDQPVASRPIASGLERTERWRLRLLLETPRAAIWEDFIDIFYAPSAVFRRREHGSVFIPLLVVTVLTGAIFYLNSGALQPLFDAEFDRQMAAAMRDNPKISPEVIESMRGFASRVGQIGVFVFLPIAMLCVGVVTWMAGKLVDAKAVVPYGAGRGCICLYASRARGGGQRPAGAVPRSDPVRRPLSHHVRPGRFLDPDTASSLLIAIVGRLDLFTLWITAARRDRSVRDRPHSSASRGDCRRPRVARRRPAADPPGDADDVGSEKI